MKIGVLGSGDVAKALAGGFLQQGYVTMVGTRDQNKLADWIEQLLFCKSWRSDSSGVGVQGFMVR